MNRTTNIIAAIGILLAFAAPALAITGTVERIIIQAATNEELDETVLEPGLLVYRVDDPKDVRIGDGMTSGGISLWNYLALTNPPSPYDRDLDMEGHAIELNSHYRIVAEGGYLSIYHIGTNPVFRLVGSESAGTLGILESVTVGTNIVITVQHVDGDAPPVLEGATDIGDPIWTSVDYELERLSSVTVTLTFPQPETGVFTYYRVSTSVFDPMANFLVPVLVDGSPVLTAETDPAWTAASGSVVYATTPGYTAAVEQAATAYGWGDHGAAGYALSSALLGYLPSAQAATQYLSVTSAAAAYLPLSGYDGLVVLGTRTRGYAASTNLGEYGFAAGAGTSAGYAGFAAGLGTSAGYAGFAAGDDTSAGYAGFAAGDDTSAGDYGFAAGLSTSAGDYGFAAGRAAKGADGSFVFADSSSGGTPFNRTNIPDSFSLRVAGGAHFLIGTNWLTATNDAQTNLVLSVPGTVSAGSFVAAAGATNLFIRPDGGTNAIYFDSSSNMVIAVDGSPALTISPAGDVGVGTTPSASFSLRTDASFYAGGAVRAGSGLASLNGKILMNNTLNSYIELVGTNLLFTATNGVTGRVQMIYE